MARVHISRLNRFFEHFAVWTTNWVGSAWAFVLAVVLTLAWLVSGPLFGYSDTWQLVMNTISSIVTFLMVFLIQRSQNKDTLAMQIKLNEVLAALKGASNRLIDIEDLSEEEVHDLHRRYQEFAVRLRNGDGNLRSATTIENGLEDSETANKVKAG